MVYGNDSMPIANVLIYNVIKKQKTYTNKKGEFSIFMCKEDTVYFFIKGHISKRMYFFKEINHYGLEIHSFNK